MIVVLSGTNDFLRQAKLVQIRDEFIEKFGDFGLEKIDAADQDFGRILEAVSSVPFLSERRMILLSDVAANKQLGEQVDELIESIADTTDLIFIERKFDKRSKLYKTLKKQKEFYEFNELDEQGLAKWLVKEAEIRGGKLSFSDALLIIKLSGPNQMNLSNELEKLLSMDKNITKKTAELLIEPMPQSTVFELIEAAFQGNSKKAIELYEDQRKQQVEPQAIMGMIAWQVHVMAVVKFNDNDDPNNIASKTKLNPYVVRKTASLVNKMSKNETKKLVEKTLTLDTKLKSEPVDADDAIQHFILTI